MKIRIQLTILAIIASISTAFNGKVNTNGNLKVIVNNIRNPKGEIQINLYDKSDGFPGESTKAYKRLRGKINGNSSIVTFENIQWGTYAISIYHDENNDKIFNETWYGMPKEGVAVSNNPKINLSAPTFEQAKFIINQMEQQIMITMKYL